MRRFHGVLKNTINTINTDLQNVRDHAKNTHHPILNHKENNNNFVENAKIFCSKWRVSDNTIIQLNNDFQEDNLMKLMDTDDGNH